jgi:energy-coupling factor transporter ATP-binding protein EcfA2
MKLNTVHVTNFRSAEDSEEFSVEQVTCLVGKNEAGKSAILLALAALNPHPATPAILDKERDYPRRILTQYSQRHPDKDAVAITTTWELSDIELKAVAAELGDGVITSRVVQVRRRYQSQAPEWEVSIDLRRAIKNALESIEVDEPVKTSLLSAEHTQALIKLLGALPAPTPEHQKLLARLNGYGSFTSRVQKLLEPALPQFMYFSNYDRMDGAVQFERLRELKGNGQIASEENRGARLFLEFLEYAGIPFDDILSTGTFETFNAKLQAASNNITDQILEYWTQNPDLSVIVTIDPARPQDKPPFNAGTIGRARIYNHLHRVDTPFSERSAGFVWFFSFLVKFAQVKAEGRPVILLLDEPGLTLHGRAQGDLLRYFDEKLAPYHQIVYSTHSPFMVPPTRLTSARIVEDLVEVKGTRRSPIGSKVRENVLTSDPDTLFPLQGALGYEITQALFIGKHTLLVEGVSDIIYLQALSHALKAHKRSSLDPRWTICPSGGIGNVRAFVSLFGGNNLDVAVLTDQTKSDTKKLEELRRSEILKRGRIFTIADFTGKPESDIEDLFEPGLFASILNSAFELPEQYRLSAQSLENADMNTGRLVKKAEAAFNVMPAEIPIYDHYSPASWLLANPQVLAVPDAGLEKTLDRAEALFKALNALLPAPAR